MTTTILYLSPFRLRTKNADEHPFEESEIEDAGFTLDDVEDDDILEDLDDSESGAMFSFDISADDEEI